MERNVINTTKEGASIFPEQLLWLPNETTSREHLSKNMHTLTTSFQFATLATMLRYEEESAGGPSDFLILSLISYEGTLRLFDRIA